MNNCHFDGSSQKKNFHHNLINVGVDSNMAYSILSSSNIWANCLSASKLYRVLWNTISCKREAALPVVGKSNLGRNNFTLRLKKLIGTAFVNCG